MKDKRAQEGIIVTVLLILIAIAAVALIATFVVKNVRQGTTAAEDSSKCLSISMDLVSASAQKYPLVNSSSITIKRDAGGDDIAIKNVVILANGKTWLNMSAPAILESKTLVRLVNDSNLSAGDTVELVVILDDGYNCGVKDTATAV